MKGMVAKHPSWHPVTESDRKPPPDPDPRAKAIDFSLSEEELKIARGAMARFGGPCTKGLESSELLLSDLSSDELIALGGGAR